MRPAVCGMIAAACFSVFKSACLGVGVFNGIKDLLNVFEVKACIAFVGFFVLIRYTKLHPIFYIIPGAIIGIIFKF